MCNIKAQSFFYLRGFVNGAMLISKIKTDKNNVHLLYQLLHFDQAWDIPCLNNTTKACNPLAGFLGN